MSCSQVCSWLSTCGFSVEDKPWSCFSDTMLSQTMDSLWITQQQQGKSEATTVFPLEFLQTVSAVHFVNSSWKLCTGCKKGHWRKSWLGRWEWISQCLNVASEKCSFYCVAVLALQGGTLCNWNHLSFLLCRSVKDYYCTFTATKWALLFKIQFLPRYDGHFICH